MKIYVVLQMSDSDQSFGPELSSASSLAESEEEGAAGGGYAFEPEFTEEEMAKIQVIDKEDDELAQRMVNSNWCVKVVNLRL